MATQARHGLKPDNQDVKDLLEFLEAFGDRIHQGREEGVLFPALLQDRKQSTYPKLSSLSFEHDRQRFLLAGLHQSLLTASTKNFVSCITRLVEILRVHLKDEESTLFPLVDSTLSIETDESIVVEMKDYDKQWQEGRLPGLLQRLDELESKYFGKSHAKSRAIRKAMRPAS
jgi:hemerythrin-like domain-containing protein